MADYKLGSLDKAGKTAIHIAFTNEEHDGIVVEDANHAGDVDLKTLGSNRRFSRNAALLTVR